MKEKSENVECHVVVDSDDEDDEKASIYLSGLSGSLGCELFTRSFA